MPDERLTPNVHAAEAAAAGAGERGAAPPLENAELVQLQIRVIALENLLIALLAQASEQQLDLARHMAAHISPRAGATPHRDRKNVV